MIGASLEKEKELHRKDLLDSLLPLAIDIKNNNNYGELMVMNTAFLIENKMEAEFHQKLENLDAVYGGKISFKLVMVPPFNFVNLKIDTKENVFNR